MTRHRAIQRATAVTPWLALFLFLAAAGCDPPPPRSGPPARPDAPALPTTATLETLAVLTRNSPTAIAITPDGRLYFNQPAANGRDVVLTLGAREVPEPTALTSAVIAEALGQIDLKGNIIAVATRPPEAGDEQVYFLFTGDAGKQTIFALGQYHPRIAKVRVLATTDAIVAASGLGASIELAVPHLVCTQNRLWLILGTPDETSVLLIDLNNLPARSDPPLTRPFRRMAAGDEQVQINRPAEHAVARAGAGDAVLLADAYAGALFRIESSGQTQALSTLVGLSSALSRPAVAADGRILLAAAEAADIPPRVAHRTEAALLGVSYPALLLLEHGKFHAIDRDRITARPGLPRYALRLQQPAAAPDGTFIIYDAASGELMRLRLK